MCFVWIWEQTAIISLYKINWLVFMTETECVYCAVRTESLYLIQVMCFVSFLEQTAIISLYSINWLIYITEAKSVYCAVSAEALNLPSTCFSYQQDKWTKLENPPKSNVLSDVGEHWLENCFHLVFKVLVTIQEPAPLRNVEWRDDLQQWWTGDHIEWNRSWPNLSNCSGICVQGLRKTDKS